jgi:flagellar hook-associated protein 3 FlgL
MIRVATVPLQRTMSLAMASAQAKLADTQKQLQTGKKASSLADLGPDAGRTLSARSLLSAQQAQSGAATRLGTTLSLYDANISSIDTATADLRASLMTAIGTGATSGLQTGVEAAFDQVRAALNAGDGSGPLFAGSQTTMPFKPVTLADTVGATPATAFANDDVRASARVGDGIDVTYGVTASDLGGGMLAAFRTLAEAGTIGDTPTAAQLDALRTAVAQIDAAAPSLRAINAENGRRQASVETLGTRADDRATLLRSVIADAEDADPGQIAIDLAQQQLVLKASYSVFSQLSDLSLTNYLR